MPAARASREHSKKSTLSDRIRLREKCLQPRFVLSLDQHPELIKREHRVLARDADVRVTLPLIVEPELQSAFDAMSDTGDRSGLIDHGTHGESHALAQSKPSPFRGRLSRTPLAIIARNLPCPAESVCAKSVCKRSFPGAAQRACARSAAHEERGQRLVDTSRIGREPDIGGHDKIDANDSNPTWGRLVVRALAGEA